IRKFVLSSSPSSKDYTVHHQARQSLDEEEEEEDIEDVFARECVSDAHDIFGRTHGSKSRYCGRQKAISR
ncbi:hypothetical protein ACXVWQ_10865, partial [Haemophilus sp. SZY H57]